MSSIQGIMAALVTPYGSGGAVSLDRFARLCEYALGGGVQGLFVCGTTGEFLLLDTGERKRLAEAAVEAAGAKGTVIVHVSALDGRDTGELVRHAKAAGADGVAIAAPCYYRYTEEALFAYFSDVCRAAGDMAVYLYNIPQNTGNALSPTLARRLVAQWPNLGGLKDSSMEFASLLAYREVCGDTLKLMTGNDAQILPSLEEGAEGAVAATACVAPALVSRIYRQFLLQNREEARRAQRGIYRLCMLLRRIGPIRSHKYAVECLSGISCGIRSPFLALSQEERAELEAFLYSGDMDNSI